MNLLLALLIIANISLFGQSWQSEKVIVHEDGCLSYPEDVNKNRIPDFSFAGYKKGEEEIPNVNIELTISPIEGDNTTHIQNAIDQIGNLPIRADGFRGALMLNPGTYEVYGEIKVDKSGIVIKGAGDGPDDNTNTIILAKGNSPSNRDVITLGGGSESKWEDQINGTRTNITSDFVQVGSFSFEIENTANFQVGDNIIIHHPGSADWVDALDGGGSPLGNWSANKYNIVFNRYITNINGNQITIDAPIYNHLDKSLSQSYIYKLDRAGIKTNIGIQDIRIDIEHTGTNENHAKNALVFKEIENGWAKKCTFLHFIFSGILMNTASYITVENCNAIDPESEVVPSRRYNFNLEDASNNILFKECFGNKGRHTFTSNGKSTVSGIVFLRCISEDPFTSSEGHRHWTTGMLFDNFRDFGNLPSDGGGRVLGLYNRGEWGSNHGWSNAHSVAWNCDLRRTNGSDGKAVIQQPPTAQNYAIGGYGNFTGVGPKNGNAGHIEGIGLSGLFPESLYEAQLNCRLNQSDCQGVFASSHDGNVPENVLDNDLNTRWSASGDGEYIEFCFGEDSIAIQGIGIAFYRGDQRQSYFNILASNNKLVWDTILSNQVSNGQQLTPETFTNGTFYARYLRYVGYGNSDNEWNSITEFEIDSSIVTSLFESVPPNVQLFPNPTQNEFTIEAHAEISSVKIFDINGRIIHIAVPKMKYSSFEIATAGTYFVTVHLTTGEKFNRKVIVLMK